MKRILIAGCGDVGGALASSLRHAGHQVWGMRRRAERLPADIEPITADLSRPDQLKNLPSNLDTVFFTSAASDHTEEGYRSTYFTGLNNLLTALTEQKIKPQRVFFTSSTGVYGQTDGSWVDETSQTRPTRFSGKIMLEAETLLHHSPFSTTAVRFGGIYGPGRTRLLRLAAEGRPCVQQPPIFTNRIHRDDCAGVLRHLMTLPWPEPLYLAVDDKPAAMFEVRAWLAAKLGRPEPQPLADPKTAHTRGNKRCRNRRLKETGFVFQYPSFREGYAELIDPFLDAEKSPG